MGHILECSFDGILLTFNIFLWSVLLVLLQTRRSWLSDSHYFQFKDVNLTAHLGANLYAFIFLENEINLIANNCNALIKQHKVLPTLEIS